MKIGQVAMDLEGTEVWEYVKGWNEESKGME